MSKQLSMREHVVPAENVVILTVQFAAYEHLLREAGDTAAARFAYDGNRLELMSPSSDHERCNRLLERLISTIAAEWQIQIESAGSTTLKTVDIGAEPDSSFYIANAASFIGKRTLDLSIDPPPDLAIEIDLSRSRINKRRIYSTMGVPEFWRYDGVELEGFRLDGKRYEPIDVSHAIPNISIRQIGRLLEMRSENSQTDIVNVWRMWLQENSSTP